MRPLPLAILAAALLATPALAAPFARVTGGNVAIRTGPGSDYAIVGSIRNGTEVELDYCTQDDEWCHVAGIGWVDSAWLVGWSAKMQVTPFSFLSDPAVETGLY